VPNLEQCVPIPPAIFPREQWIPILLTHLDCSKSSECEISIPCSPLRHAATACPSLSSNPKPQIKPLLTIVIRKSCTLLLYQKPEPCYFNPNCGVCFLEQGKYAEIGPLQTELVYLSAAATRSYGFLGAIVACPVLPTTTATTKFPGVAWSYGGRGSCDGTGGFADTADGYPGQYGEEQGYWLPELLEHMASHGIVTVCPRLSGGVDDPVRSWTLNTLND